MNSYVCPCPGAPLMPEIATDPPTSSCNRLYPRLRFQESQSLGPDPFLPRARRAGAFAMGNSGNPPGAARQAQSQAAPARSFSPAAERAGRCGICSTANSICCGASPRGREPNSTTRRCRAVDGSDDAEIAVFALLLRVDRVGAFGARLAGGRLSGCYNL